MKILHAVIAVSVMALASMMYSLTASPPEKDGPVAAPAAEEFIIRDARIFDGEKVLPRASVHVRDGLIVAVGVDIPVSKDIEVIEGAGRTLLPGLIDAHVHTWGDARRDALRFGVTTELDMFSAHQQLAAAKLERTSLAATDQADSWSAGTLATAPGGHGTQYGMDIPTVSAPEQASAWVAARKAEGSDYIKIVREDLHVYTGKQDMPTLDDATAAALVRAAHDQGLRAVVHASAQASARQVLRDGADGLVHVFQDAPADDDFIALARERKTFVVATLSVIAGFAGERQTLSDDTRLVAFLSQGQKQTLQSRMAVGHANPALIANARESVRRLHAAGVTLLAGTDAPNPNTAHGVSLHQELEELVRAGLSPQESLAAATSIPAKVFSLQDRGRIGVGLRADLLLVEGDPTVDITATRAIAGIWKNGHRVDRSLAADKATMTLRKGIVGDFDAETLDSTGKSGWLATTDKMMGGASTVELSRIANGADGSAGALRISGEIAGGAVWPWAGAMYSPGATAMAPVDAGTATELVLHARGDGREYSVMLFSGAQARSMPAMLVIHPTAQWSEFRLKLDDFPGADKTMLRAVGFTAGAPAGPFQVDIDAVEIR